MTAPPSLIRSEAIRTRYALQSFTLVGDRGMVTPEYRSNPKIGGITTISALTDNSRNFKIAMSCNWKIFDERNISENPGPEDPEQRYCLCKDPTVRKTKVPRARAIELTIAGSNKSPFTNKPLQPKNFGAPVWTSVGKIQKWVNSLIGKLSPPTGCCSRSHQLQRMLNEEKRDAEAALDGCYIIRTDVSAERMTTDQVVQTYKSLGDVERAFRNT